MIFENEFTNFNLYVTNTSAGKWILSGPDVGVPILIFPAFLFNFWETGLFAETVGLAIEVDSAIPGVHVRPSEFRLLLDSPAGQTELRPAKATLVRGNSCEGLDPIQDFELPVAAPYTVVFSYPIGAREPPPELSFALGEMRSGPTALALPRVVFRRTRDALIKGER